MFGIDAADRINGSGGDDIISGGMANDRLTGGAGADEFWYYQGETGRDIITDFDANSGMGDRDLLNLQGYGLQGRKSSGSTTL